MRWGHDYGTPEAKRGVLLQIGMNRPPGREVVGCPRAKPVPPSGTARRSEGRNPTHSVGNSMESRKPIVDFSVTCQEPQRNEGKIAPFAFPSERHGLNQFVGCESVGGPFL
jgi:hypothetical protein